MEKEEDGSVSLGPRHDHTAMQDTIPYGPPPPPPPPTNLVPKKTYDQLRPRWDTDQNDGRKCTEDRSVAPEVVMEDVTPPVKGKDMDVRIGGYCWNMSLNAFRSHLRW